MYITNLHRIVVANILYNMHAWHYAVEHTQTEHLHTLLSYDCRFYCVWYPANYSIHNCADH